MPWPSLWMPPAPPWGQVTDQSEDPLLKLSGPMSVLGGGGSCELLNTYYVLTLCVGFLSLIPTATSCEADVVSFVLLKKKPAPTGQCNRAIGGAGVPTLGLLLEGPPVPPPHTLAPSHTIAPYTHTGTRTHTQPPSGISEPLLDCKARFTLRAEPRGLITTSVVLISPLLYS